MLGPKWDRACALFFFVSCVAFVHCNDSETNHSPNAPVDGAGGAGGSGVIIIDRDGGGGERNDASTVPGDASVDAGDTPGARPSYNHQQLTGPLNDGLVITADGTVYCAGEGSTYVKGGPPDVIETHTLRNFKRLASCIGTPGNNTVRGCVGSQ